MHVTDANDLIDVHVVVAADLRQLICKGDVHRTEGVLHNLGHFGGADVGDHDLTLAEGSVDGLDLLANRLIIRADGTVVVQQLIDHVAGDNALRSMNQVDILADGETVGFNHRTDKLINGSGRDCRFNDHSGAPGTDLHDVLYCGDDITGIHLLAELVVGGRHGDDVGIRDLILRGKANACLHRVREQLVQTILLEGGFSGVQGCDQFLIIVRSDNFHAVGS